MRVNVALTHALVDASAPLEVVVVIDVVRAMSTVVAALSAGAVGVEPVAGVEEARARARERGALLGGERGGLAPDGFDLGNSPRAYDEKACTGRDVVLSTTNGTVAVEGVRRARRVLGGCLRNAAATARAAAADGPEDILLVCAGTGGGVAADDVAAAGCMAGLLAGTGARMSDAARLAAVAFEAWRADLPGLLRAVESGRRLLALGLEADLDYCAQLDASELVAELDAGRTFRRAV